MSEDRLTPAGDLSDCARCYDRPAPVRVPVAQKPAKPRKPRSKGAGSHCVLSHKGRVVHCYTDKAKAERVAEAFTRRGKSGAAFRVGSRKDGG